ncbi:MAG: polyprenol monophosphomannose synthase [Clostridium sp.]|nr:polyprenol monophosphomannose synthase [Prevotella sp.]MCM1428680.1 polyprenol monophosphomannose synthase [Clostridium sp.]MCM1475055.1 polyprenol monophosphomannose synthase [Muribaculaceae bacterium]
MSDVLVIIPTYNEIENIEKMLDTVMALPDGFDVLVIDDGSPDGTATAVKQKMTQYPERIFIEERSGKLGLGTAYIHGFKWALSRGYQYVIEMDADFSHNPNDLTKLYHECKDRGADVSVGSRYISGVNVVNWPMGRVLMSYFASAYVRFVTRMKLRDSTAGFVCYRRKVLETINLDKVEFKGYAFQIEMKYTAWKKKFKIVEVPIIFINRQLGVSKMNSSIFGEAVFGVIKLRIRGLLSKI